MNTSPPSFLRMTDIPLAGKRVFIRADLNVPQDETGKITDDTRIRAALPAIEQALKASAAVMVCSHLGRPQEGQLKPIDSLAPIADRMSTLMQRPIPLVKDWVNGVDIAPGQVVLLENCRGNVGEKNNDPDLSRRMASLCDVYVFDAFGSAHRAEATTHGMALCAPIAVAGPLMVAELEALAKIQDTPQRPLLAIVGGAKVSTKLSVLESLSARVDVLIPGGGIANTFLLAQGYPIGASLAEPNQQKEARATMQYLAQQGRQILLPTDVVVAKSFTATENGVIKAVQDVLPDDMILDIGPISIERIAKAVASAGTVVWNGPVGVFEFPAFANGTRQLSMAIAQTSAFTLAGGGDTIAAIAKFGIEDKIDYMSTGGGAFLEFLEGKKLPAVAALEASAHQKTATVS